MAEYKRRDLLMDASFVAWSIILPWYRFSCTVIQMQRQYIYKAINLVLMIYMIYKHFSINLFFIPLTYFTGDPATPLNSDTLDQIESIPNNSIQRIRK